MQVLMTTWHNWSGSVSCSPAEIAKPSSLDEIVALVQTCVANGTTIRAVGSGHSFTPLVANEHLLVSLDHYVGLESTDRSTGTVTVRAGTKLKDLGKLLFENGLAQENLGDINEQSIAGAISTGTHGTGVQFGSLSTQVAGLTLVTGTGQVVTCSEKENPALFKAAQVSLGALGLIVSVTLRVVPRYVLKIDIRKRQLSECLANLDAHNRDNRHFEFHWIPYTDTVQAKFTNLSSEPPAGQSILRTVNEYVIENGALWLFSAFNRQFPAMSERVCRTMAAFITDASGISHAHEVFASARLVKFQEMEYNLPASAFSVVLGEIGEMIRRKRIQVHFPVECRFVRGDDIYLSPAYGRDSAYIAVHMFRGMPYQPYFEEVEAICVKHGGRPHWGKMHFRTASTLAPAYPMWRAFQEQRAVCDPNRVFTTPYIESVLG